MMALILGKGKGRYPRLAMGGVALALVAAACGGGGGGGDGPGAGQGAAPSGGSPQAQPAKTPIGFGSLPAPRPPSGPPPQVNTSIHSVPLSDVVFDTFQGGFIRLSQASLEQIERLRDAIIPIYRPRYDGPEGGRWLEDDDLVIGYETASGNFAYPVKILNFQELVNDEIDGIKFIITYCPLCGSGVVFNRVLDGQELVFGNTSALYQTDLVMYDHQTSSYWFQTGGEAIVGPLTGRKLEALPSVTIPWRDWLDLHGDTQVLSRTQDFGTRSFTTDPFKGFERTVDAERFPFPVDGEKLDRRLRLSAIVISVKAGGADKAYPLEDLGDAVVNDGVGGVPLLVISRKEGPSGRAFDRRLDGRELTFESRDGAVRDRETGSRWNFSGKAVEGPLAGKTLTPLPTTRAFWFSLAIAVPDLPLFQP